MAAVAEMAQHRTEITVTRDAGSMAKDKTTGLLVLHHHNSTKGRARKIIVE